MKKMLQIFVICALAAPFVASAADKASLQRKLELIKRHREEAKSQMHEAMELDASLGESYKSVIANDDKQIAALEAQLR